MNMALLRLLLIMIVGGTGLLFIGLLPLYGIRRKKNPNDPKNTIPRLMGMSFLAVVIMVLLFCSGLIVMYMDDKNIGDKSIDDYFEIDEATKAGKIYMEELGLDNKNNIDSYNLEKVTEAANYVILDYKVIRKNPNNIDIDLDSFNIKVEKKEGNYEVSKIKSKNSMRVYTDKNNLRIRDEETGMSELLLRERDTPL